MTEEALEEKVAKLSELAPKEEERYTLATRLVEAVKKSINYTVGKVRGFDDEGIAKDFAIGEYNKEEGFFKGGYETVKKIVNNLAETLVTYLIPKKSKEERKKFMDTLKEAKMFPEGVFAKFNIDVDRLKEDLMLHGKNVMASEHIQKIFDYASHFVTSEVEDVKKEIKGYALEFKDKLYGLTEKALGKLGYKLEPKKLRDPRLVPELLQKAYAKNLTEAEVEKMPYVKKKSA